MAYLYGISIDCGGNQSVAFDIARSFVGKIWCLSNGVTVEGPPSAQSSIATSNGTWRCNIIPDGVSAVGIVRVKGTAARVELTRLLYSQLKESGGYRFACAGWEVFGDLSAEDIVDSKNDLSRLPPGLVVNRDLWLQLGAPSTFVQFGQDTFWNNPDENGFDEIARYSSTIDGRPDY